MSCLVGIRKPEYKNTIETESQGEQFELMKALKVLIGKDDSARGWAKWNDELCFARFVVDFMPTPVLEECVKAIRQRGAKSEEVLLRALLELYQDTPLRIPAKELNDLDSYRKLKEIKICFNKDLRASRGLLDCWKGPRNWNNMCHLGSKNPSNMCQACSGWSITQTLLKRPGTRTLTLNKR